MKCADYLPQLFAKIITFYKDTVLRLLQTQSSVTGENNPVFLAGHTDQTSTREMSAVNNILSQHPEPFGKPAKHDVGGESQFRRSWFGHLLAFSLN